MISPCLQSRKDTTSQWQLLSISQKCKQLLVFCKGNLCLCLTNVANFWTRPYQPMHHILIYTEVKHQSFNELAKAIERERQKNSRRWVLAHQFQKESLENSNFSMEFPPENELVGAHFPSGLWKANRVFALLHALTSGAVLSLAARDRGTTTYEWKNTRNKKMKVGVAIYKKTTCGKIGWQRCSNIAFIELYKNKTTSASYLVNMMST